MQISFQPQDSSLYIEITPSTSWKENPKPWRSLQIKKDELCWCQGRVRPQLDKLPKFLVAKNKALKDGKTSKMMFWSLYRHHLIQFIWRKRMAATFNFCVPTLQKLWRSMEVSMNSALFRRKHQAKNYTSSSIMMRLQQEMFWLLWSTKKLHCSMLAFWILDSI